MAVQKVSRWVVWPINRDAGRAQELVVVQNPINLIGAEITGPPGHGRTELDSPVKIAGNGNKDWRFKIQVLERALGAGLVCRQEKCECQ